MADKGTLGNAAGSTSLPPPAKPRKARKTPRSELRWATYIHKVLEEVHPEMHISKGGLATLTDMLDDLMERPGQGVQATAVVE